MRHGAGAGRRHGRRRPQSRDRRLHPPVRRRRRPDGPPVRDGDGLAPARSAHSPTPRLERMGPVRPGDAGGVVGGLAVHRARLDLGQDLEPEHVHPDRARDPGRLGFQHGLGRRARPDPRRLQGHARPAAPLFRGRRRHRHPGALGPTAGVARPRTYLRRHPSPAGPGAKTGPAHPVGRNGRGDRRRTHCRGRPPARAAGRESPGRWPPDRRPGIAGRVARHR